MKQRQTGRTIGGAAIIAAIILLILAVTSFSAILQAIRGTYRIHAVFDQATGLRKGAAVWIAGRSAGRVHSIGFMPVGRDSLPAIVVALDMPNDVRPFVRRDSNVRLASARMIGDPVVDITPGSSAAPVLSPGDTLFAGPTMTQEKLMQHAGAFSAAVDSLMTTVALLDQPIERSTARYERLLTQVNAASTELATLRVAIAAGLGPISTDTFAVVIQGLGATMQRIRQQLETAARFAEEAEVKTALHQAGQRAAAVAREAQRVNELLGKGFAGRLQTDSALTVALRRTQAELDSLIAETKKNPLRFWFGK